MTPFEITIGIVVLLSLAANIYYRVKIIKVKDRIISEQDKRIKTLKMQLYEPLDNHLSEKYTRYKVKAEITTPDFELIQSHPNRREHAALIQNKLNSKLYDELITCGYVRYYDVNKFEHGLMHVAELEIIVKQ